MQRLLGQVERASRCRWPVLILGETGTGKSLLARIIHERSSTGPFVTIDCGALVGNLLESELFGHTRNAFTGANADKKGMLELAHGGTAFLDEIGELPLDLQVKLLRVLQEREIRPVGGLVARKVDVRIIAATNRDLSAAVEEGSFRRDLYFRLNVIAIKIPALRERREDIPLLVRHFLAEYGSNHSLTRETMDTFMAYHWPGNVRELENTIQRMVAMNSGPLLHLEDLPSPLMNFRMAERSQHTTVAAVAGRPLVAGPTPPAPRLDPPILPLAEVERRAILEALKYTKGDRTAAAALLGIGRTTLYRKLKQYADGAFPASTSP
jgi:transcriptional regulator with PAS, ATPase and Fis domain